MSRELLQQALDALRRVGEYGDIYRYKNTEQSPYTQIYEAIDALNVELAKPEQEPVALKMVYGEVCCQSKHDDQSNGMWCPITEEEFPNGTPFYTAPPRKPWVGLTDEERNEMISKIQHDQFTRQRDLIGSTQIITEMYLKERNT
jgi:hypothetical protein